MSDALGQDQFQPVNRRAGYGDALEMALSAARKGWTLSAGQGALIVEHYEEQLAAARDAFDTVISLAPIYCEHLHHTKKDYHKSGEPCPVEARIKTLIQITQEDA